MTVYGTVPGRNGDRHNLPSIRCLLDEPEIQVIDNYNVYLRRAATRPATFGAALGCQRRPFITPFSQTRPHSNTGPSDGPFGRYPLSSRLESRAIAERRMTRIFELLAERGIHTASHAVDLLGFK